MSFTFTEDQKLISESANRFVLDNFNLDLVCIWKIKVFEVAGISAKEYILLSEILL